MPRRLAAYQALLLLYPKAYRHHYGNDMVQTLSDMLDGQDSRLGQAKVWLRVSLDLPVSIVQQNLVTIGGSMHSIPHYIKWSGLVGALMLVPFTAAVVANMISVAASGHPLYQTWLWSLPILRTWVLILPGLALALALFGYINYVASNKGNGSISSSCGLLPRLASWLLAFCVCCVFTTAEGVSCATQPTPHNTCSKHWFVYKTVSF